MKYDIIFIRADKVIAKGKSNTIPVARSKVFINKEWLEVFQVYTRTYVHKRLFGHSIKSYYVVDVFDNRI